ncbi:hypothetical protein BDV59DRAFT_24035 [Aspergillus ambiguus]|uniref:uncharacterized protein n=1 Tax=Aspergillus ambiguus TaxID=176160 RepID=UPI003CCCC0F1
MGSKQWIGSSLEPRMAGGFPNHLQEQDFPRSETVPAGPRPRNGGFYPHRREALHGRADPIWTPGIMERGKEKSGCPSSCPCLARSTLPGVGPHVSPCPPQPTWWSVSPHWKGNITLVRLPRRLIGNAHGPGWTFGRLSEMRRVSHRSPDSAFIIWGFHSNRELICVH